MKRLMPAPRFPIPFLLALLSVLHQNTAASAASGPSADGTWSQLLSSDRLGWRRHSAIFDPARNRLVVFGGETNIGNTSETWVLALHGPVGWERLPASGPLPSPRHAHAAIYDPTGDRMIIHGGAVGGGVFETDIWQLAFGAENVWSELSAAGASPAVRAGHRAVYDPLAERMIVFGGASAAGAGEYNDTWALKLAENPAWTRLEPSGPLPVPRRHCSSILDPLQNRIIIFGGWKSGLNLSDTWALTLGQSPAWSLLNPGAGPSARREHTAVHDTARRRMVVFGGNSPAGALNDAWSLALSTGPDWTQLLPTASAPTLRWGHEAVYHPVADRMLVVGGFDGGYLGDVWELLWDATTSVGEDWGRASASVHLSSSPNPFAAETRIRFALAHAGLTRLEVFDVSGRRVREWDGAMFPLGTHELSWRGDDDARRELPSGTYFLRLETGVHAATHRVTIMR